MSDTLSDIQHWTEIGSRSCTDLLMGADVLSERASDVQLLQRDFLIQLTLYTSQLTVCPFSLETYALCLIMPSISLRMRLGFTKKHIMSKSVAYAFLGICF
jgi:hypothetical protein